MKRFILFTITIVLACSAGFFLGRCCPPIETPPEPVKPEVIRDHLQPEPEKKEEEMSEALKDPDFRRVHDFLERENPMQMNLGDKPSNNP
ncbi:MAG: hypothetical protein LBN39_01220 [Planctomycetaceae bacterium]|nr:hypothetical protein [Planctomycetaceae bacterium]